MHRNVSFLSFFTWLHGWVALVGIAPIPRSGGDRDGRLSGLRCYIGQKIIADERWIFAWKYFRFIRRYINHFVRLLSAMFDKKQVWHILVSSEIWQTNSDTAVAWRLLHRYMSDNFSLVCTAFFSFFFFGDSLHSKIRRKCFPLLLKSTPNSCLNEIVRSLFSKRARTIEYQIAQRICGLTPELPKWSQNF